MELYPKIHCTTYIVIFISADPAVAIPRQGGAWDHRRCRALTCPSISVARFRTDHQAVRPPKLSLLRGPRLLRDLRDPGLPRQRFKRPAGLDPGLPRQRFKTPQAALAVKAVISKGSSTARFGRQSCHF